MTCVLRLRPSVTKEHGVRILLVQPEGKVGRVGFRVVALPEPLAVETVAATAPDHELAILDMRLDKDLDGVLERFAPDVVAVTALTTEVYAARGVMAAAKRRNRDVFTVVGGYHATLVPEDFFRPYVDAICLGEAERVFPQLIAAWSQERPLREVPNLVWRDGSDGFVRNARSAPVSEMDAVPLPRRDLTRPHHPDYFWLLDHPDAAVVTARGCPYRCSFCSVWEFYQGRTGQMGARRVVEELREVDAEHITFMDDNFMLDHRREAAIAARIKAEGLRQRYSMECRTDSIVRHPELIEQWKEVGLDGVFVGLEGATDQALSSINKRNSVRINGEAIRILKANGVLIVSALMVDPDWTAADFDTLYDYMTRMELTLCQVTVLTPLPGTRLYREKYDQLLTHDYRYFDAMHSVLPTRLPREEFYQRFAALYRQTDTRRYFDLIEQGILSKADLKWLLDASDKLSRWESYAEGDPLLGAAAMAGNAEHPAAV
jgi:radical SAM superfamily enzyme YgiQ (UPF0313 family)